MCSFPQMSCKRLVASVDCVQYCTHQLLPNENVAVKIQSAFSFHFTKATVCGNVMRFVPAVENDEIFFNSLAFHLQSVLACSQNFERNNVRRF
jgi:hypothetical protein